MIDIDLAQIPNVENVNLTGMANLHVFGSALNNRINGNDVSNVLTGEAGNDILDGNGVTTDARRPGNDTYSSTQIRLVSRTRTKARSGAELGLLHA